MSGFEEVGIAGSDELREALTNCTNPVEAIQSFQSENGILLPSLHYALPLLDLHGINRLEFHQSIMEELSDKLISRLQELASSDEKDRYKKIEDLLAKSFPLISISSVQPVVMAMMKHLPEVPEKYLNTLVEKRELYQAAATEVKRQIWQENSSLFGDEVSPLLAEYISDKEKSLFGYEPGNSQMFFVIPPKTRRQGHVIQTLTNMVGKNVKLYDRVLQFLRTLFLRTKNVHYCTLRAELLMSLHDLEVHEITSLDPCHKFTWCLDACIREKFVDEKRARELQTFLDGIRRGQETVLGDLSMILCDPYAIHTIANSTIRTMLSSIASDTIPRASPNLALLMRMLTLGVKAWNMIDSQVFKEPKMEHDVILKFLPCIMSLIVDDQTRSLNKKLNETETDPSLKLLPEIIKKTTKKDRVAATVCLYYVQYIARQKNRDALLRILPFLILFDGSCAYQDTFLHAFVAKIIPMVDEFASDDFNTTIFDKFLMKKKNHENVSRHAMRLLTYIHHKLPTTKLEKLMKDLEPLPKSGQITKDMYSTLQEKISSYNPSPVEQAEPLDSPLLSVPTPAPL
ncbi:negative elongation factor B-like [Antedon mediterranea]|uniref:negative elongation factor B-like n=1 Tax=Antedon mediterranea TaxID=105859 RepID=UPI003AF994B6